MFGGGIIPNADIAELEQMGVARIFTPGAPTTEIVDWVRSDASAAQRPYCPGGPTAWTAPVAAPG